MVRVITRQSFFSKYRNYILSATPVVILLVGLGVTYSLIQGQFDIRTRATIPERDLNVVYRDELLPGWIDKSIDANNIFTVISPVFLGQNAISFENIRSTAIFYLHREKPLTLPYWAKLEFSLQAGSSSGAYSVSIVNEQGNQIGDKVYLINQGGNPQVGYWKSYSIPLSNFGTIGEGISGIIIRDESGTAGNTLYIDEVKFEITTQSGDEAVSP